MDERAADVRRETVEGLGTYLNDHLAGSVAGAERFARLASALASTSVGPAVDTIAQQVAEERDELRAVLEALGLTRQNRLKQAAAWAGEHVARLKSSRRSLHDRRTAALLEVEILRAALVGKLGVWQVLEDVAGDLGLEAARMTELRERTLRQVATMDEVHAAVRARVLRAVS
ncbi:hypothetical protein N866_14415 [Actinotalea ferrariae CF5-4]|uniref:Uncharacterized protein n=1 Tax=Actinotalea ferrariae CF5-4 TaxID=948458 RepID=A0A021VSR7_9CELL|nr:hypothetical protein [Actinotalea ferrariae]EYR64201.1 hypothetical protein N866_14415 [Actinotalea ferrariae CF5-4]